MIKELKILSGHGRQFITDLRKQPVSERFRGLPVISDDITGDEIKAVSEMCPVNAIDRQSGAIDLGKCAFCNECALLTSRKVQVYQ